MTKKEERQAVFDKYNGHCAYCGSPIKVDAFEVDHKEPLMRGHKNRDVDYFDNKEPACRPCNRGKKYHTLELWRIFLQDKIKELNRDSGAFRAAKRFGLIQETGGKVKFYFETFNDPITNKAESTTSKSDQDLTGDYNIVVKPPFKSKAN